MDFKDYYKILGVEPSADLKAIKTAYRKLARKYHPDVSKHDDAEQKFKETVEAYDVLKDPQKRAEYDELYQYAAHGQPFTPPPRGANNDEHFNQNADYSDFFSSIFGQAGAGDDQFHSAFNRGHRPAQDIETDLPVFLEDTLNETRKTISYELNGVSKTLNVKVPLGVNDGERIRLKGQGPSDAANQTKGDLYLRIRLVPHPLFDVEAHNLVITLPLSPWEAALGTSVKLPTLDGDIQLKIPPCSQSGQRLRIKGKGLITKNNNRGDLYAALNIVMPKDINETSKTYWENLAKESAFDPRSDWLKA